MGNVATAAERMARDAEERGNMRDAADYWGIALFLRDLAVPQRKPVLGQQKLGLDD